MPVLTAKILAHTGHPHERRKPVWSEWWCGLRWFTASALFVLASIGLPSLAGYHWNLSSSVPLGLVEVHELNCWEIAGSPRVYGTREGTGRCA